MTHARVLCDATLVPHRQPISAALALALVDATAAAGFDGVTLWSAHHDWAVADGLASEAFFEHHEERGVSIPFVEVLSEWATADGSVLEDATLPVLDVAARAGASSVIAVTLDAGRPTVREVAARLARVCDLAADRGLRVSFEFLPWSGVPNLSSAATLLDAVDRANLGLVLDTWHWHHQLGGPDLHTLRSVPADRLDVVQLNDAPPRAADPRAEGLTGRLLPGAGVIDIGGVIDTLADIGANPVVASEVFSHTLACLGPEVMAAQVFAATDAVVGDHFAWGRSRRSRG